MPDVLVVGLSHRSAPLAVLERAALDPDTRDELLARVADPGVAREAVILATCNRVEIYAVTDAPRPAAQRILALLAGKTGVALPELSASTYVHEGPAAVRHLFRVVCGLDSMLVGDAQIRGQVREAYRHAQRFGAAGRGLHELFQRALRLGKRAESDQGIGRAGRSLVDVGLDQVRRHLGDLTGRPALVVGAGGMGSLAASAR
ncbi:glutamyl-tRNA reductase, partial [Actinoplanes sp. NPDC051411]